MKAVRGQERESDTVEFKVQWIDRALEDLAAFANHRGGTLLVGVADNGSVSGFAVSFLKDPYTPERLQGMGLNERQIRAVLRIREQGSISNEEYMKLAAVSKPTATRDLDGLVERGLLERVGRTGRGTRYVLKGSERAQRAQKGLTKAGGSGWLSERGGGSRARRLRNTDPGVPRPRTRPTRAALPSPAPQPRPFYRTASR